MASDKVDFFISYTNADRAWAEWIAWLLEEAGYSTRIQAWDFRPSSNFIHEMQTGASLAERTIAVLSPAYLQSRFTKPEWYAAFAQDPTGEKGVLLPVRVEACELEGLLPQIVYIDLVGLQRSEAKTLLLRGVDRNRAKPEIEPSYPGAARPATGERRFPGALPPIWNVELLRNRDFTGRDKELTELRKSLECGQPSAVTQAVHGLGGIGKSQLALEYVYRYHDSYELVWWVPSGEPTTMIRTYAFLANEVSDLWYIDGTDVEQMAKAVRDWLEHNGNWLLVFDNAAQPDSLHSFIPRATTGHVLITSRYRNWGDVANPIRLGVWPRSDAVKYVIERTDETNEFHAAQLATELGDLPLALAQATGYIRSVPGLSINQYLELFKTQRAELWQDEKPPCQYEATVSTTWNLTVKRLSYVSRCLLHLFAFLAPENVLWKLLEYGKKELSQELAELTSNQVKRNRTVRELTEYSLVDATLVGLSMHRMLQTVVRDYLAPTVSSQFAEMAVRVVHEAFPYKPDDPATWHLSGQILPHVMAAVEHAKEAVPETCGQLLNQASRYLQTVGRHSHAQSVVQEAIEIGEKTFEPNHPTLATSYETLGAVESTLGDYEYARAMMRKSIQINKTNYEPNHPTLATNYSNLGLVEHSLGNLEDARALLHKAIQIKEANYETNHPALAELYLNLAGVEQDLGNLECARTLLRKAIQILKAHYRPDHPFLAISYSSLAGVEQSLGNVKDARGLLQKAIKIEEANFQPNNPALATTYSNLGLVEQSLGNLRDASALLQKAIQIKEANYEPDHPSLGTSYSNLAMVEYNLHNFKKARPLLQKAIQIGEAKLAPDHPLLANRYWNLGCVELAEGKCDIGRSLLEKAYAIAVQKLGPEHPMTLGISSWLAACSAN